jgi:hypothetical protein
MTPESQAALFAWLNANAPLVCVGFVVLCAILGARSKRDG